MKDFVVFCGNDHVVHVDVKPSLCNLFLEDIVYYHLESSWGIGQAKEHNSGFKKSFASFEGSLIFITFLDANVVVTLVNVEFGK